MRLSLVLMICCLAAVTQAQLSVGPNGVGSAPINLLTVFRFVRNIWNSFFYPEPTQPIERSGTEGDGLDGREGKRVGAGGTQVNRNQFNPVIEKFDSNCEESGTCAEQVLSAESKLLQIDTGLLDKDKAVIDNTQDGSAQLVVSKWSLIYVVLITMLFWPLMVLATPYFFTGIPLRREDSSFDYDYFNSDDILLLLSWLLGEVSNDQSCLEAVVCRSAPRSSQYITLTSTVMNIARLFQRWLPYSPRIDSTIRQLGVVAHRGLQEGCGDYYCQNLPDAYQYYYDDNHIDDPNYTDST